MKRILLIACALLILSPAASAMTVEEVPNPQTTAGSFVQDSAGVLGSQYVALIDGLSNNLKAATGAELAVVTVGNMNGATVEDFAERLFQRFGIGQKEKDNGVLILFSLGDRKVRIEVGYGLEGALNDAKAGRILDTYAVPTFKKGEFGKGLFETARAVAQVVAQEGGVSDFAVSDPKTWPKQVTPPEPVTTEEAQASGERGSYLEAILIVLIVIAVVAFIGISILSARVKTAKSKAAKEKAVRKGATIGVASTWISGVIALVVSMGITDRVFVSFLTFFASLFGASALHVMVYKKLKKYVNGYRLTCSSCGKPMDLIDEDSDDAMLSEEEIAEERADGMDYEFWKCTPCDRTERFNVKIGKAKECPKCSRMTLVKTVTTLKAATYSDSGLKKIDLNCKNSKCGHHESKQVTIPKKTRSSSGSGSSSSSGGSFSGGSSGGGGSSRSW